MAEIINLEPIFGDECVKATAYTLRLVTTVKEHNGEQSHIHDCCEVYINLAGNVSFVVENNVYPVTRGDVIITKPNEFHHCVYHEDGVYDHFCAWIDGEFARKRLLSAFFDRKNGEKNLICMKEADKERLICAAHEWVNAGDNKIKEAAAMFTVLNLINENKERTRFAKKLSPAFAEIVKYIDGHYNSDCSSGTLTKQFYISRSTLNRWFKQYYNLSPGAYVETRRLTAVKKLLEKGESVQVACMKCGFPDYSHFIALFKRRFGITPYKYSKNF